METSTNGPTRRQTLAVAIITVLASLGVVWLMVSILGNGSAATSTTVTSSPPPTEVATTVTETTTTLAAATTTTLAPVTTATVGVFDEVDAVEAFITEFAGAIESGDSAFLFERLHPAVKATYEEEACRAHIDQNFLPIENYRRVGPVLGPFDSEFGEFPLTSYEAGVAFEIGGEAVETTAVFSLTEGVVRWLVDCD